MASPRLAEQLKTLTHAQLLALAVDNSPQVKRKARLKSNTHAQLVAMVLEQAAVSREAFKAVGKCLAIVQPLPEWATSDVLLSLDLLPTILSTLGAADLAAAKVCRRWRSCWKSTLMRRRILHPAPLPPLPTAAQVMDYRYGFDMVALDGDRLAVFNHDGVLMLLNTQMERIPAQTIEDMVDVIGLAVGTNSLYTRKTNGNLYRYQLDSLALVAETAGYNVTYFAVGGGHIFGNIMEEIAVFDAATLAHCFTFGRGVMDCALGMAASSSELFVCDMASSPMDENCIQVFSLAGHHLRTLRGGVASFAAPWLVCFLDDRLYVIETDNELQPMAEHRVVTLTPQGELLQVVEMPDTMLDAITIFDGKLFVSGVNNDHNEDRKRVMKALQGV